MSSGYGGFTAAARELERHYGTTRTGRRFTRQQVWAWHNRRAANGFPVRYPVEKDGKSQLLFALAEVVAWYPSYVPDKGGRPHKERK